MSGSQLLLCFSRALDDDDGALRTMALALARQDTRQ